MKTKLMISMIAIVSILVACTNPNPNTSADESTNTGDQEVPTDSDSQLVVYDLAGYITSLTQNDDGTIGILVENEEGDNGADYDKGHVTVTEETVIYLYDKESMSILEEGQYVNVFFEGEVMESYPIQATARQINIVPEEE